MNTNKILLEIRSLKKITDNQADCQWCSFQFDFEDFCHSIDSLVASLDIKVRNKLCINLIGDLENEVLKQTADQLSSSKLLKGVLCVDTLSLQEFIRIYQEAFSCRLVLSDRQMVGGTCFSITEESTCRIGRHPAHADMVIPSSYTQVEHKHAVIFSELSQQDDQEETKKKWFIRDLSTHTGTFLNHEKVDGAVPLKLNDSITLGGKYPSPEVPELLITDCCHNSANQLRKIVAPADIYILFLELENQLGFQEKEIISYLKSLETDDCLIIILDSILEGTDETHAWISDSTTDDTSLIYIEKESLIKEDQNRSNSEYQVIEDSIRKYLLDQSQILKVEAHKSKRENLQLKSIVKALKEQKFTIGLDRLIQSSRFIDDFAVSKTHKEESSENLSGNESQDAQDIVKYLESKIKELSDELQKFKSAIKAGRSNLEKKKSNPNHLPVRVRDYIDNFTEIRTINSSGRKQVKLTGIDGADVNLSLLEYCRYMLLLGWIQQESNAFFYGEEGIGDSIFSLAKTLRDEYGVPEKKLSDLLSIEVHIPDEDEITSIFREECRTVADSETYESSNPIFYLFGSLRRHIFQIMSPLILLTMLGIGSRTDMMQQIMQAIGGNWIFKFLAIGLVLFFFYNLINNYLKDQRDRQLKAAAKIRENLRSLYVDFIKESLLDPAQNFLEQELARIFGEINLCLDDIRREYSSKDIESTIADTSEQNKTPDLSAILTSIEKIRKLAKESKA
jgi:hypothetical protein